MQANYVQRLRLTFGKMGPARFIGHLDLSRTLERSFNRAHIPIAYTQGFNRRPRMSLAAALPLGFTSDFELADIWLEEEVDPATLQNAMMRKMAPGINVSHIEPIPLSDPSLQSVVSSAIYVAFLQDAMNREKLQDRVEQILEAKSLPQQRKRGKGKMKVYDLRPLIIDLGTDKQDGSLVAVRMELCLGPSKSGRPDDVLAALSIDPHSALIHRKKILLSAPTS
jgi:radical SAM-linked protein